MRTPACLEGASAPTRLRSARLAGLAVGAAIVLAACGGGTNGYADAVDAANAKQAEARALASPSPCSSAEQCGLLSYFPVSGACACPGYQAYSLVSATAAAASAAAAEQGVLASQARALSGSQPLGCACAPPPRPACTGSLCQAGP